MSVRNTRKSRSRSRLEPEALESRELLTGTGGDTFAIIPGSIKQAGGTAQIQFTINPANFTIPNGKMVLGLDIAPDPSTTLKPMIISVTPSDHATHAATMHSRYDPTVSRSNASSGFTTSAVLTPITFDPKMKGQPQTFTVTVRALAHTTGNFLLGFYLPGDVTGAGTVTQADLNTIKSSFGVDANSSSYSFYVDSNRDGLIGPIDLKIAKMNLGVSTSITPSITSNLDPATDSGLQDRITSVNPIHFTGAASPGSTVTYTNSNTSIAPVSTTADSYGNYSIYTPLASGANNFTLTTHDSFGQTITGSLATVTLTPNPPRA